MQYRRAKTPGATYFFTVVTYQRQTIFDDAQMVDLLRQCFRRVLQRHPFVIEAMVVLREHLHCLWTLPDDDADFSMRWRLIKSEFSRRCRDDYKKNRTVSRMRKGEQAVWQRRFWEHQIRNERDESKPCGLYSFQSGESWISGGSEGLAVFEFSPLCAGWVLSPRLGSAGVYSIPTKCWQ